MMILAVVLIILMPVLTVSLFAYKILKDKLYEEFYRMNEQVINAVDGNMELYLDGMENLMDYAMISDELVAALKKESVSEKDKLVQNWALSAYINKLFGGRGDIDSIRIYDREKNGIYERHNIAMMNFDANDDSLLEHLEDASYGCQYMGIVYGNNSRQHSYPTFVVGTKIVDVFTEKVYGYLLVSLNFNTIGKILDTNNVQEDFLILLGEDEIIYDKNGKENIGKKLSELEIYSMAEKGQKEYRGNFYLHYSGFGEWNYLIISDKGNLLRAVNTAVTPLALVSIICFLTFIIFSVFLVNRIIAPLNILKKAMQKAQENNFNSIVQVDNTYREMKELVICFNVMQVEIKKLMQSEKDLLQKKLESEYRALQFQITPHFLYNSLDSINCLACSYGKKDISEMILSLSHIFRYSTGKDEERITLGDEINHAKNYCLLQAVRFQDRFQVEYQIEERFRCVRAIKFMLQPLVENAIYHGAACRKTGGKIVIGAVKEESCIIIFVWDNGDGFAPEQYKRYKEFFGKKEITGVSFQDKSEKIGLINVHTRLKFTFGEEAGLFLWQENGTAVCIRLPD